MPQKEFHYSIEIIAHPEEVWYALTHGDMTKKFMYNCEPITDWNVGSTIFWRGVDDGIDYVKEQVIKFIPNETLAFTVFNPHGAYEDTPKNYLTSEYNLSATEAGTMVEIRQWDYTLVEDGEKRYSEADAGWDFAMKELKKILEQ